MSERETQASVVDWCRLHYPGEDALDILRHAVEELGELAADMGADADVLAEVFRKSAARNLTRAAKPETLTVACPSAPDGVLRINAESTRGEVGDMQVALWDLADALGFEAQSCVDAKMVINRARSVEESAARKAAKAAQGI